MARTGVQESLLQYISTYLCLIRASTHLCPSVPCSIVQAARAQHPALTALVTWAPAGAVEGLQLISGPAGQYPPIKAYAIRCLVNTPPKQVCLSYPLATMMVIAEKPITTSTPLHLHYKSADAPCLGFSAATCEVSAHAAGRSYMRFWGEQSGVSVCLLA